jgi:uncharacterized protein (TIGR02271 family)
MPTLEDATAWRGRNLIDSDGDKIGSVEEIYVDRESGEPEWLAVKTGLFGTKLSFVPLAEAQADGDTVRVPYDKAQVKDSPNVEADGDLSPQEESQLYRHYGRSYDEHNGNGVAGDGRDGDRDARDGIVGDDTTGRDSGRDSGRDETTGRGTVGQDVSGPETDDAMTRSEEELDVGTRQTETGRVRLRKHVVTEPVETTVEVQREEVRLEREPITDANRGEALSGGDITEEEHEVTLRAEEPVVEKQVVPKERVRLDKDTVTEQREITDEVRKEQIDTDGVDR